MNIWWWIIVVGAAIWVVAGIFYASREFRDQFDRGCPKDINCGSTIGAFVFAPICLAIDIIWAIQEVFDKMKRREKP